MKIAYHILMHLLGIGCVAACIAIVATMGGLDLHVGWMAVAFFVLLAVGILTGWFPWRGKPLRVMIKGFYVMSALALIGFGFAIDDPLRPPMWLVLSVLVLAIAIRLVIRVVIRTRARDDEQPVAAEMGPRQGPADDPFLN